MALSSKHRKTLQAVFDDPACSNVKWSDIEGLPRALGAELTEGRGSRIRISLSDIRAIFHRPYPQPETDKGALKSMRRFLDEAGIRPGV